MSSKDKAHQLHSKCEVKINSFVNTDYHKMLLASSLWGPGFILTSNSSFFTMKEKCLNFATHMWREGKSEETTEKRKPQRDKLVKGLGTEGQKR